MAVRKLITIIILCAYAYLPMQAQEEPLVTPADSIKSLLNRLLPSVNPEVKAHMNLEFYTSAAAYFTEGSFDEAAFKINRVRKDLSQIDLAKRVGVTRQTIGMIEAGDYNPTLNLCIAICKELGKTLDDIFWEENENV